MEPPTFRRFTADEAMRMVEMGILGDDEPVELLDGLLVEMSPKGPEHVAATIGLSERFRDVYRGRAHVREEKPLAAGTHDLPEPDVAVVRGRPSDFSSKHPLGRDAVLIVELAFSSQRSDRRKAATYAAAGVPVYWIVDLVARKLEVRTTPENGAYQVVQVLGGNDTVDLPEASERWVVRDLFPTA